MSLLDTPAAPEPRGARVVRPMDDPRDSAALADAAPAAVPGGNKSAVLRRLLHAAPDGLGYDELSRGSGIARDKIYAHVTTLLKDGDAKAYELPDRGRVFKFTGDPARVGNRFPASNEPGPRAAQKAARTAGADIPRFNKPAARAIAAALPTTGRCAPVPAAAAPAPATNPPAADAPAAPEVPPAVAPPVAVSEPTAETRTAAVLLREIRVATLDELIEAAVGSVDPRVASLGRKLVLLHDLAEEFRRVPG